MLGSFLEDGSPFKSAFDIILNLDFDLQTQCVEQVGNPTIPEFRTCGFDIFSPCIQQQKGGFESLVGPVPTLQVIKQVGRFGHVLP